MIALPSPPSSRPPAENQQAESDKQRATSVKRQTSSEAPSFSKRQVSLPEKSRSAEDRTLLQPEKKRSQIRQDQPRRPFDKKQPRTESRNVHPASSESLREFSPASFVEMETQPAPGASRAPASPPSEISLGGCETVDVSPLRTPNIISQEKLESMAESKPKLARSITAAPRQLHARVPLRLRPRAALRGGLRPAQELERYSVLALALSVYLKRSEMK
ncbi:hypothetical protein MTO96_024299 [Rhipicephalus appendiculatus]